MKRLRTKSWGSLLLAVSAFLLALPAGAAAGVPSGFQDTEVLSGLNQPSALRFAPDGRLFVAEKPGRILVYDDVSDPIPDLFADLRKQVFDTGDRGLLGLALDPEFPADPYVYAMYTFDHMPGEPASSFPRWGKGPTYEGDDCSFSPEVDACPVTGRVVRLQATGNHGSAETVLVEDWCQQNSSHSVGDLEFGPEGALFASGGDGASFNSPDYGQFGWPQKNVCGDPPGPIGTALTPPGAEGGSLRSQDLRTPWPHDPTGLDGTVIRIDPATGAGMPGNPLAASADANERRIIAYGFRNPFRIAVDAAAGQLLVGNVGYDSWEEIDRLPLTPSNPFNSGWPCYEGNAWNGSFSSLELTLCEQLYDQPGSTAAPFAAFAHYQPIVSGDPCYAGAGAAISGSVVYGGDSFPSKYDGALFFADPVRSCIYVMYRDGSGKLDPTSVAPFMTDSGSSYPGVDVQVGPGGSLFYARLFDDEFGPGSIHRIRFFAGNSPPEAELTATPQWGETLPLQVTFDASGSTDPDADDLKYEWDLEGDGTYAAPGGAATKTKSFNDSQNHTVFVRVADELGANDVAEITVYPGTKPPQVTISSPAETAPGSGVAALNWAVGDEISFSGNAVDRLGKALPVSKLSWTTLLYHCPGAGEDCHGHPQQVFPGTGAGTLIAPDHDYPSYVDLILTATDDRGLTATKTLRLDPRTVEIEVSSQPAGVALTAGPVTEAAPFTLTAIEGAHLSLSAPSQALLGDADMRWKAWSDGGERVHAVVADEDAAYTALYEPAPVGPPPPEGGEQEPAVLRPETILLKRPKRRSHAAVARIAFRSDQPDAWFQCKLDAGPLRPCRSPRVYRNLRPGPHILTLRALTPGGKEDLTPAVVDWRVSPAPVRQ